MGDLDNRIAEALGRHPDQCFKNAAEMSGNEKSAAFPCGEKVVTVKNKMDDRLPNPYKVNIIHNCVLRILTEDFTKIRPLWLWAEVILRRRMRSICQGLSKKFTSFIAGIV